MKIHRLFLWPFAFLFFLGDSLEELRFRLWIILNGTAQWALGEEEMLELICKMLRKRVEQLDRKYGKMGGE